MERREYWEDFFRARAAGPLRLWFNTPARLPHLAQVLQATLKRSVGAICLQTNPHRTLLI
jgi:hypothetical protein